MSSSVTTRWTSFAPQLQALLRVVAAACFMTAGTTILFGFPAATPKPVALWSQAGIGGVLELVGGALLLVGLFTRPVAFVLSGMMAVAYFQFHAPNGFWPTMNGGVPAILYCLLWLWFSAAGPGAFSLDALRNAADPAHEARVATR